ncbi:F0F1 ATP synthase subunit epsilon [Nitrosophilus kaiyonis]|uniref:F0F1 ATP synthase subunit epsilon n=1 Tax=Nitrosophilus kaiyonis TaxID=2930200 RepID=UPI0024913868|nr:hypothetical protein [Nitrosophilus kaiyonis]
MKSLFDLIIISPTKKLIIKDIEFFRGEDESGTFGILAHHIEFLTILTRSIGIIKKDGKEQYIALNKGILRFNDNKLFITTREFIISDKLEMLKDIIDKKFKKIEEQEKVFRHNIQKLEKEFIKKVIKMEKELE